MAPASLVGGRLESCKVSGRKETTQVTVKGLGERPVESEGSDRITHQKSDVRPQTTWLADFLFEPVTQIFGSLIGLL